MAVQGVQPFQMFIMVVFLATLVTIWFIVKQYSGRIRNNFMLIVLLKSCRKCRSVRMMIDPLFDNESLFFVSKNGPASLSVK